MATIATPTPQAIQKAEGNPPLKEWDCNMVLVL
jgi:hypothetical protein